MKYFIVGLHGSGKREITDLLEKLGVKCGKNFSDIDEPSEKVYGSLDYELYTTKEVNELFENNAYIFLHRCEYDGLSFYEGLTQYEFENNDVFVLSPDQLVDVSFTNIKEPYCFIWIDDTRATRLNRHKYECRSYNFNKREEIESKNINYFINLLYSSDVPVLYFNNEETNRIASIVYALIKHEDLLDIFSQTFNS